MAARSLANPWSLNEFPSSCERVLKLHDWTFTCQAFNSRGTYLACGTAEGHVVVWDFATLSPALVVHGLHRDYLNSLTWVSRTGGRVLCTTSSDGTVKLFDLEVRKVVRELRFGEGVEVNGASTHPRNPDLCLVCLSEEPDSSSSANTTSARRDDAIPWPRLHDFSNEGKLKCRYEPRGPEAKHVDIALHKRCSGIVATFSKRGQCVFVGGQAGNVLVFSTEDSTLLSVIQPPSLRAAARGWVVGLTLSRNGKMLLVDSGGKAIAVYDVARDEARLPDAKGNNFLPADASVELIQDAMRWRVGKILRFKRYLEDSVNNSKWADITTSWSEYVLAASSAKDVHELFVWDVSGSLVAVLKNSENAGGQVRGAAWHPWRPVATSISGEGDICLWTTKTEKNWLAFAPGFHEIEENVVYQESDEFDPDAMEREKKAASAAGAAGATGASGGSSNGVSPAQRAAAHAEQAAQIVNVMEHDRSVFSEDEDTDELQQPGGGSSGGAQSKGYFIDPALPVEVKL